MIGCASTSQVREQPNLNANSIYLQQSQCGGPPDHAASIVSVLPVAVGYSAVTPEPLAPPTGPGYFHPREGFTLHAHHFGQLPPPPQPTPFPPLVMTHQSAYINAQARDMMLHPYVPQVQYQYQYAFHPLQQVQQEVVSGVPHCYQSFGSNSSNSSSSSSLFGNSKTRPRAKRWVNHPPRGSEMSTDLFLGNLPPHNITKSEQLVQLCRTYGRVDKAQIATDETGKPREFGFVKFATPAGALNAFYELQKRDVSFVMLKCSFILGLR